MNYIRISGVTEGGASQCFGCPVGYEATTNDCRICPPGKYSSTVGVFDFFFISLFPYYHYLFIHLS